MNTVGVIAIGRNEGERLRQCLASLVGRGLPVVYVDSKSTDGSPDLARSMGAEVVVLDMSIPFCAARARNEGFDRLMKISPDVSYVQFVDGDCEVAPGWLERAKGELEARPEAAAVCGRRRERHPEASIYNRLADLEWNTPIGEAKSVGGDSLMRAAAFKEAGGFDATVAAGEEPELCQRMREKGWKIYRIDAEMTVHDSAMLHFTQWWKRAVRSGYGAMDVATRFRRGKQGLFVDQVRRARKWAVGWPVAVVGAWVLVMLLWLPFLSSPFLSSGNTRYAFASATLAAMIVFAAAPLQIVRSALQARPRAGSWRVALAAGALTWIGKWANYSGQRRYLEDRAAGRNTRLIDYKAAGSPQATHA
jgi:glycosyltransferase involved in cell wall biosynthesis